MGKIRVKAFGDEEAEKEQQEKAKKRIEAKKAQKTEKPQVAEEASETVVASEPKEVKAEKKKETAAPVEEEKKEEKKTSKYAEKKAAGSKKVKRSKKYAVVAKLVDKNKIYSLKEGLKILPKLQLASFDETVELHINTIETGISGTVMLPHGTGKQLRIVIATDAVIAEVAAGKINFDILVAAPQMMPKLAKVAKVLGPKGLMPNPKNGTISEKPEEAVKKFSDGQMRYKTEAKAPVIHVSVGKLSFGDEKLFANIKTVIHAIKAEKIRKTVLKSTMSPAIKIDTTKLG